MTKQTNHFVAGDQGKDVTFPCSVIDFANQSRRWTMQSFSINRNRVGQVCAIGAAGLAAAVIWTWVAGVGELLAFGPQPKPMSPGAALLSLLFGVTLYFYYRDSQRPAIIWITFSAGGVLVAASGWVCLRYWLGWDSPVERWLATGAGHLGNFPVGQISRPCGMVLLLAGLALILRLQSQRSLRSLTLGLAAMVLLAGLGVVVSYAVGPKWISGLSLSRISLLGGMSFIFIGGALLGKDADRRPTSVTMPMLTAAGLALIIGTIGALALRQLQAQERVQSHQMLKTVSDLKVEEIVNWREERLADAQVVGQAPMVGHDLQLFLAQPRSAAARADLVRWLNLLVEGHRYALVEVYDTAGVRRLSLPDDADGPDREAREQVAAALRTQEVVVRDIHRSINHTSLHYDLAVVVRDAEQPVGVVRLVLDPRQFLYSILEILPLPQQSAEAALFRVDGDEVVALSEVREQTNAVLNLRLPIEPTSQRPSVKAALGSVGEVEGIDYRGVPVLAATRKIPNSPWYLITKVDAAEIYAPIHRHAWLVLSLTILMTALVGILAELFWERKRLELAERIEHLMNHANDVILLHDEYLHILEANKRALELYGYSLAELRAMPSAIQLRAPDYRADYHIQTDPLFLNDQAVYESVHQRKDGTLVPVEISSRVVIIVGKRYVFSIIRDLTRRKVQEKKILQLSRYYDTLSQINQSIVRVHSRKELFRIACQLASEHGGFKATWIGWLNRETRMVVTAAAAGKSQEFFERVRICADDQSDSRDTIGMCVRTGQPAANNDIARDQHLAAWHAYAATYDIRSMVSVPVRFRGEVAGVFTVVAGETDVFHAEEIKLLGEIAVDISYALDTLDKDDQRQQAENELFLSRERYRSVFENMLDGFCRLQLVYAEDKVKDAIYSEVNPAFERLTGLQNVVGKKISDVMPGIYQTNPELLVRFTRVAKTGKAERYEEFRQQIQKWLAVSIVFLSNDQVIIIFEDTSTRHASDDRLQLALQAANAIVWENNLLTGEATQVGDLAAVFGSSAGHQHVNRAAFLNDVHPDDRARVDDSWRTVSPSNSYRELEFRVCLPTGGIRWLSSAGTAEFDNTGRIIALRGITRDVTATHLLEEEREIMVRALDMINSPRDMRTLLADVTKLLQNWLGCDAVGIRLRAGDDFPYYETRGFPSQFVELERQLCQRDDSGRPVHDAAGTPVLECLCGCVLNNQGDRTKSFITERGSFWTNSATEWLAGTTEADRPRLIRGRCIREGYESIALLALRAGATVVGLLQINDKRTHQFTAARITLFERLADSLAEGIAHRQNEKLLRESEVRFRLLIDGSPDAMFIENSDGIVLDANSAGCRLHGAPREKLIGCNVVDLVPAEYRDQVARNFRRWFTGELTEYEGVAINLKDGRHIPIEIRGTVIEDQGRQVVLLTVRDITERQQIQQAFHLRSNALQAAANAVVITDATGAIEWVNTAFMRLTGYTEAEVCGQNLRLLKSGRHDAAFYRQLWETICAGRTWQGEIFNRRKDGSEYNEEMTITPVANDQGKITHFIAIKQDVTARKQNEQELVDANRQLSLALTQLRDAQKQLVAQERLRALGQMASGIAHDFNNALTPIIGFADLLLQHPDWVANRDRLQHYIHLIHLSAQDAAQIVRRLHEFHRRRRSGEVFLPLQLNALVRDTVELTAPRWRQQMQAAGVTITLQTDFGDVPVIQGNEAELRDALTSLIFNAVDSMPQGGSVTIRTALDGNQACLEIADTGTGMSAEARQHCFEPFYSTTDEHGAGLGLALVHGIIRRHEGEISVESEPGVGTTFTIHLPLIISQHTTAQPTGAELPPGTAHILLVDDEPQLREVLLEFLKVDQHHVELAASGAEALEKFRPGKFDVVITDKAMPGISGEQLAAEIKSQSPTTPVILLTGFGMFMQADKLPAGVDMLLNKPIGLTELRAALSRLLHNSAKPGA